MRVLNVHHVTALATIVQWAQAGSKIKFMYEGSDVIREGIVRSIGDDQFNFINLETDVRDAYVRITGVNGFDYALPVTDVMRWVHEGRIVEQSR